MASSRCLHPALEKAVSESSPILIYGPAATGKTHIAFTIYRCTSDRNPVLLATEPGTLAYARSYGLPVQPILSMDELTRQLTEYIVNGYYPIIDTINWHYRSDPTIESATMLAYASALLREAGGTALGQVSGEGGPAGAKYLLPWMIYVAETQRLAQNKFKLTFYRPYRLTALFRVARGGVEWI